MEAQGTPEGKPRGVLRDVAAAWLPVAGRTLEGSRPPRQALTFLLDTNIVSEWARPRPEPRVVAWLAEVDEDRVFLSVITLAELQHGIESLPVGAKRDRLLAWLDEDLLERFESRIIGVTPAVARDWGAVCALARRAGKPISAMDAFFAATARVQGLTLVTRNDADFSALGVELLNPWKG